MLVIFLIIKMCHMDIPQWLAFFIGLGISFSVVYFAK